MSDIQPGDSVLYVPRHAHGDRRHSDCEYGVVSSKNAVNVFVRYLHRGAFSETAQATSPDDLVRA